jgi:hypothetical protein
MTLTIVGGGRMGIDYICNNMAGNMLVNVFSLFDHPLIL